MDRDALSRLDHAHLWHPFTQQSSWAETEPLVIAAAEGCELIGLDGRRYLDAIASLWVGIHGHRHPRVDQAIRDQLDRVAHTTMLGLSHPTAIALAEQLAHLTPGELTRTFYSDSGSTAVEIALKMAFQWHQQRGDHKRTRFASLSNAYHGDTIGAVSVGGIPLFHRVYGPLLFDCTTLQAPLFREDEAALAAAAIALLEAAGDTLAAVIVEPLVQGAAGMRMHTPAFLDPVLQAARDLGALVIVDEVATGLGRTGTLFATEQLGVDPDLLCIGKGLSNGYLPLAATVATEAVYEGFLGAGDQTFFHGHTFTGNPLACAAALACLATFKQDDTLAHVAELVPHLTAGLDALAARQPHVWQVRQHGLMTGVELRAPDAIAFASDRRVGDQVAMAARTHGVVLRPLGDTMVLMPPLCMTVDQLDQVLAALELSIVDVLGA
jgi:adenosylmethionine-8-amino-7-oxononanoate aminotransferase